MVTAHLKRKQKWNESGFRPPLCTYRLNWARRTSWGWWDDWDDTVLQTQDLKFVPWRSEAEHATSRSRRLPTILTFTRGWGRNIFVSFKPPRPGTEPRKRKQLLLFAFASQNTSAETCYTFHNHLWVCRQNSPFDQNQNNHSTKRCVPLGNIFLINLNQSKHAGRGVVTASDY